MFRLTRSRLWLLVAAFWAFDVVLVVALAAFGHDRPQPARSAHSTVAPSHAHRRRRPHARPHAVAPRPTAPGHLRPGSDPTVLPGPLLIADRGNDRLVEVDPHGRMVWSFPRPGDLRGGQTFRVPDDAFFSADGRRIVATEEDDSVISVIDVQRHRIVFRYGMPGQPGAGPNQVHNPDDALFTAAGSILTADIKNCRLLAIRPPQHVPAHVLGRAGACGHDPPRAFSSPNGAFPMRGGNTVVTEIGGDWIDVLDRAGRLVRAAHPPGFSYPSDSNEVRPGVFLSVDYVTGGAVETFDGRGRLRWRFAPSHPALNKPSLALPLPNGDVVLNDDFNHRVIVVNPHSNRIVWQYGHTAQPGHRPGYLQIPDGVDLAPPYSVSRRFPHWKGP